MALTIPKIKECIAFLEKNYSISQDQAEKIIKFWPDPNKKQQIVNDHNIELIESAAASLGIHLQDQAGRDDTGKKPGTIKQKEYKAPVVVPSYDLEYKRGELPAGLADDIKAMLAAWAQDNGFEDLTKLNNIQWRAACLYIGMWFQDSGILRDKERERKEGGKRYDAERVAAVLPIWEYITGIYKHIPLHTDFIAFCGISRGWFFDYEGRGLTSSSVQIVKKAIEIENAALSSSITDGRENPTGKIFYSKARLGWREADTITPINEKNDQAAALPCFDLPILAENGNK